MDLMSSQWLASRMYFLKWCAYQELKLSDLRNLEQIRANLFIFDKGPSVATFPGASGASNPMDILVNIQRCIVVHNMGDIGDVDTSRDHVRANKSVKYE